VSPPAPRDEPADPRADLERLVAAYADAIESRSVGAIRRVYPGLTSAQAQAWEQFFGVVRELRVRLTVSSVSVNGASAELVVGGAYLYTNSSTGRDERQPVSFRATAVRNGGAWRLSTIR
jgi:hypothetical protein